MTAPTIDVDTTEAETQLARLDARLRSLDAAKRHRIGRPRPLAIAGYAYRRRTIARRRTA